MIDDGHKDSIRRYWFPCVSSISIAVVADTYEHEISQRNSVQKGSTSIPTH